MSDKALCTNSEEKIFLGELDGSSVALLFILQIFLKIQLMVLVLIIQALEILPKSFFFNPTLVGRKVFAHGFEYTPLHSKDAPTTLKPYMVR